MIFASYHGVILGMIGFLIRGRVKSEHVADIFSYYVCKKYRGRGIGSLRMAEALKEIGKSERVRKVSLAVNSENHSAINLYEKFGFKISGKLLQELKVNGKFYDELVMEKIL